MERAVSGDKQKGDVIVTYIGRTCELFGGGCKLFGKDTEGAVSYLGRTWGSCELYGKDMEGAVSYLEGHGGTVSYLEGHGGSCELYGKDMEGDMSYMGRACFSPLSKKARHTIHYLK